MQRNKKCIEIKVVDENSHQNLIWMWLKQTKVFAYKMLPSTTFGNLYTAKYFNVWCWHFWECLRTFRKEKHRGSSRSKTIILITCFEKIWEFSTSTIPQGSNLFSVLIRNTWIKQPYRSSDTIPSTHMQRFYTNSFVQQTSQFVKLLLKPSEGYYS